MSTFGLPSKPKLNDYKVVRTIFGARDWTTEGKFANSYCFDLDAHFSLKLLNIRKLIKSDSVTLRNINARFKTQRNARPMSTNRATRMRSEFISANAEISLSNLTSNSFKNTIRESTRSGGIMARINLEDQFWLDAIDVIEKVPALGQDKVFGNIIRFFRFAQEEHKQGKMISEEAFKAKGFLEELIPTFAKRTPSGIQAKGAEKYFGWLEQKVEAGRKGGRSKSEAKTKHLKQNKASASENHRSDTEASPSPSPSPSFSNSRSPSSSSLKKQNENPSDSKPRAFLARYCELYKTKYGHNPEIVGKDASIAKRVGEKWGNEKVELYLQAFFAMPDSFVVKAKHPLNMLEMKLAEVVAFAQSGQFTSRQQAFDADKTVATAGLLQRIREGKV